MDKQTNIEGTVRWISTERNQIKIDYDFFEAAPGLVRQAVEHFPVGTEVKAGIVGNTIKSLVKNDPELIG